MSKYKVGDKVLIEGEVIEVDHSSTYAYKVEYADGDIEVFSEKELISKTYEDGYKKGRTEALGEVVDCQEAKYNKGLQDAWELAKKICGEANSKNNNLTGKQLGEIFGYSHSATIMDNNTYQQALAKIEAYEESKAIKKGNVVLNVGEDIKAVIIDNAIAAGAWQVYTENGCGELWKECEFVKTDKTIDLSHFIEQIRGNE